MSGHRVAQDLKDQDAALGNIDNGAAFAFTGDHTHSGNETFAGNVEFSGELTAPGIIVTAAPTTTDGIGAKAGANVEVVEYGNGVVHKSVFTLTAQSMTLTDEADTVVYGGVKIYDFPEGLICTLGATIDGSLTAVEVNAAFDGDVALGSAIATTGPSLISTEADILQSTAMTQASGKVANTDAHSIATALTESGARWFDGTTTAKDLFLNFNIDEDAANATSTGTFTGTVTIMWMHLGDY